MDKNIVEIINPSINSVKGFFSNACGCEIKYKNRLDLGMALCEVPATCFAKYTTNKVQAAHIQVCKENLKNNKARAVIVNSGCANACTGELGLKNAQDITKKVAEVFELDGAEDVLLCSTGVIGRQLPMDKVFSGIDKLKPLIKEENEKNFTLAIMTTDTVDKIVGVKVKSDGGEYTIVGTAKGSGMIHPNMATMLGFIFTDVSIKDYLLKKAFDESVERSFNSVTIDGDTSTNDTAIIMKSGLANNEEIIDTAGDEYKLFCEALNYINTTLAKKIAIDGEGATKFIEITVENAVSDQDAKKIATSIARSSLVKTAFYGEDANWGRIICAAGYSGVDFDFTKCSLKFDELTVFKNGEPAQYTEKEAKDILKQKDIKVTLDMNGGKNGKWTVWTCDFSIDYVKINADYTT